MWSIFGKEAIYIDLPDAFKNGILAHSKNDTDGNRFGDMMESSDINFILNGETEESCFLLKVPDALTPEDIQFMADRIIGAIKDYGAAPVVVDGIEQRYRIIVSNSREPELIGIHKTPGMSSYEVFKPIIEGWDAPGRRNSSFNDD